MSLLTAQEVATRLRIGLRTVWRWTNLGRFPQPLRWGPRIVRWREADIEALINGSNTRRLGFARRRQWRRRQAGRSPVATHLEDLVDITDS